MAPSPPRSRAPVGGGAAATISLKARAIQWLAQREHSRAELRTKLLRVQRVLRHPGPSAPDDADGPGDAAAQACAMLEVDREVDKEVDALLDWLASQGHLSDARFVESRIHARQARHGNLRIRQELQQHGLVLDAQALSTLKESELQRALAVWRRKFGRSGATDGVKGLGGADGVDGVDGAGGVGGTCGTCGPDGVDGGQSTRASRADEAAARARQMRFLAGRGFSAEVIRQVLQLAGRGDPPDEPA